MNLLRTFINDEMLQVKSTETMAYSLCYKTFIMDIFGIKYKRLCKQLENEGFVKLKGIGYFYNTAYCEYYHKDGRKALCIKELFPKIRYVGKYIC